ncbi:MAG: mucoidy inhibitor MuiA family protein [Planctomycetes bacterium]|nr:mucoidy inhibitor MuiA family protein [Planctomycetota bacterium]
MEAIRTCVALLGLSFAATALGQNPAAEAAPQRLLGTSIRDVTVYPAEALITRTARAAVSRGVTRYEITGLPLGLNDDSVKLKAIGPATVVGVEVLSAGEPKSPSKTIEDLRQQLKAKQAELKAIQSQMEVTRSTRAFLESLRSDSAKTFSQGVLAAPDPNKWGETITFLEKALRSNVAEARQHEEQAARVEAEIAEIQQKLGEREAGLRVPTKTVALELLSDAAGEVDVQLDYLIGGAGWSPLYDVRAASNLGDANLLMQAHVSQKTGEDWSGVNLTFSTAKPERGAAPPRLTPMVLTGADMRRGRGSELSAGKTILADRVAAVESESSMEPSAGAPGAPSLRRDAEVSASGLATQFRVPRPETVPADGRPHRVRVTEAKLALAPAHVAVPVRANRAFVRAKPKNTSGFPILAGPAQVFVGNDFAGRITVPETLQGEEMTLYMGADPGITIERKQDKANREAPGFLQSRVKWTYGYRITVKNVSAATGPATVEVTEPIYVSRDDRIRVEIEKSQPEFLRGEKEDKARETEGLLQWRLALKPGEERTIELVYTVTAPEDLSVMGLER